MVKFPNAHGTCHAATAFQGMQATTQRCQQFCIIRLLDPLRYIFCYRGDLFGGLFKIYLQYLGVGIVSQYRAASKLRLLLQYLFTACLFNANHGNIHIGLHFKLSLSFNFDFDLKLSLNFNLRPGLGLRPGIDILPAGLTQHHGPVRHRIYISLWCRITAFDLRKQLRHCSN